MATRWGICSAGKIASDFVTCLSNLPDEEHKVVAIASHSEENARALAARCGTAKVYDSYNDLAIDQDVDIVYVGVINPYHYNVCKLYLFSGKHVLCEKPLAMNHRQAKELTDLATKKQVFFMEGMWTRCFPVYREIREILDSGSLGNLRAISVSQGANIASIPRLYRKDLGGGCVLDLGVYAVSIANFIFKEAPTEIVASGHLFETGVDMCAFINLKYSNEGMAQVLSHAACNTSTALHIYGTKGSLQIPKWFHSPDTLIMADGSTKHFPYPEVGDASFNFPNSQGMIYEAQHVRECLQKGLLESPLMPHEDSLQVMAVLDEVRKQIGVIYESDLC